jgi:hypothetical protein
MTLWAAKELVVMPPMPNLVEGASEAIDGTPKARNKPVLKSNLILPNIPAFSPSYAQC